MRFLKLYKKEFVNRSWVLPFVAVGAATFTWGVCYINKSPLSIGWCVLIGIIFALAYPMMCIETQKSKEKKENDNDPRKQE